MDIGRLDIFRLAQQRLGWLERRQEVLAQNIANANTPGYAARDLVPFDRVMARSGGAALVRTSAQHIGAGAAPAGRVREERLVAERMQDGSTVRVEDQVARVAETETKHELTVGLYRKYMGLFRITLGRGG